MLGRALQSPIRRILYHYTDGYRYVFQTKMTSKLYLLKIDVLLFPEKTNKKNAISAMMKLSNKWK